MRELQFLTSVDSQLYMSEERTDSRNIQLKKIKNSNFLDDKEQNPYTFMLEELAKLPCTEIKPRDLAYLKDLGVYPINRMFVLRRFDGSSLKGPDADLMSDKEYQNKRPISTVVGWLDDESDVFGGLNFNESWKKDKDYLHTFIGNMLKETNLLKNPENLLPVPGWSQALYVRFFTNVLGITDIDAEKIGQMFGNPNVLQEGATRSGGGSDNSFGLNASFNYTLKVTYESKYINNIDPIDAMKSISDNLLTMGSSPEEYFSLGEKGLKTLEGLTSWGNFKNLVMKFINEIINMVTSVAKGIKKIVTGEDNKTDNKTDTEILEPKPPSQAQAAQKGAEIAKEKVGFMKKLISITDSIGGNIFDSTIGKYRWPLRAVYGIHTGNNTTPWHLTIGNPLSPVMSLNNIVVEDVFLKGPIKDMTYGDIPKYLEATINVVNSRNMGINTIGNMIFRNHRRVYASPEILDLSMITQRSYTGNKDEMEKNNEYVFITENEKREEINTNIEGIYGPFPFKANENNQ